MTYVDPRIAHKTPLANAAQRRALTEINRMRREATGHGFLEASYVGADGIAYYAIAEGCEHERVYPVRQYRVSRGGRVEVLGLFDWRPINELTEGRLG